MKKLFFILTIFSVCTLSCKTSKEGKSASSPAPLCETEWILTAINCEPIAKSPTQPYVIFKEDGSFSGSFGCNDFFGTYFAKKDKMNLEFKGATKKLCNDMVVEKAFSAALKKDISNYVISDDVLIIREKRQEVLRFKAAPKN